MRKEAGPGETVEKAGVPRCEGVGTKLERWANFGGGRIGTGAVGKLAKHQAGQGEERPVIQYQLQSGGQLASTRPLKAWEGLWTVKYPCPLSKSCLGYGASGSGGTQGVGQLGSFLQSMMCLESYINRMKRSLLLSYGKHVMTFNLYGNLMVRNHYSLS